MIDVNKIFPDWEIDMMNKWVMTYAAGNFTEGERVPFEDVLSKSWAIHKEKLYNIFGEKLILSKDIVIPESFEEVVLRVSKALDDITNPLCKFTRKLWEKRNSISYYDHNYEFWNWVCGQICDSYHLTKNIYNGRRISIYSEKLDKTLTFDKGIGAVKMLGKIAEAFDIEGFEEFRIEHSRLVEPKGVSGTLCLSIHPMDYMTMSDNSYDWQSCMNWRDWGCYRRGTVEMMNSPMVVVAYLKGSKEFSVPGSYKWNNKKWRTLLVMSPELITSIKGYPYQHNDLNKIAVEWLAELANLANVSNYDMKSCEVRKYGYKGLYLGEDEYNPTDEWPIAFSTNSMYNDFGSNGDFGHCCIFSMDYLDNKYPIEINYSGDAQCVWCGGIEGNGYTYFNEEENLCCVSCGGSSEYCPYCDSHIDSPDDLIDVEGYTYCECCIHDECARDAFDGEWHHYCDMRQIYLVESIETTNFDRLWDYRDIWVHDENLHRVPATVREREWNYTVYIVERENATPEILRLFGIWDNKEENLYFEAIKDN